MHKRLSVIYINIIIKINLVQCVSYDLTSALRVGRRSFKLFLTDNYAEKTISCLPGLLLRDGCLTAAREGDYASLLFENFCDYLSE